MDISDSYQTEIEIQRKLYEKILDISSKELLLLHNGENEDISEKLSALIERRQILMNKIDQAREKIKEVMNETKQADLLGKKTFFFAKDKQTYLYEQNDKALRQIILDIHENDKLCQECLKNLLVDKGNKISSVRNNKKAYKAYNQVDAGTNACFFDKKK